MIQESGSIRLLEGFHPIDEVGPVIHVNPIVLGQFLKAGDTVGSYLIRDDDATVKVVFYLNGRCLGPGFVIPSFTADVFYPCLHLDGKAKVTLKQVTDESPFFNLASTDNMIVIYSDRYQERPLTVAGPGAGADVTAAGVFAELIQLGNRNNG